MAKTTLKSPKRPKPSAKSIPKPKAIALSLPNSKSSQVSRESYELLFNSQKKKALELRLSTAKERIQKLKRLRDAILSKKTEIQSALYADFKKSPQEVDLTEILPVIGEINDSIRHLKNWMRPLNVKTPVTLIGAKSQIVYEPKGVCLIISPWNYPFHLAFAPIAAAISAGNTIILKPSEFTPNTSKISREIISMIFQEEEVAVREGDASVSQSLLELPFDHIFFTGSTPVGKVVMAAAAKHLTSVTLELGGKSPSLITEGADLKSAAERIMWGKFVNAGQTCVAPDYVLIPKSMEPQFIEEASNALQSLFKREPSLFSMDSDFCRIINDRNFDRVNSYIESAKTDQAKIALGGQVIASDRFISPTILTDVKLTSRIMQDEIFGPLLPVINYETMDEAISIINERDKPLALYIFTNSKKDANYILKRTSSGGAVINDVMIHLVNPNLPFGGVNHSGHGSYHGHFGFKAFSHERSVLKSPKFSIAKLLYPPYTDFVKKIGDATLKWFI